MQLYHTMRYTLALGALAGLLASCGLKRHPYENPITKDTQQPDKVLFDKAIHDMEHSRYEIARLTLQTLINTYDTSEYLAKAKLAIADSWYKEGGAHGLAQAEAEYKDFILFYPQMEESAEAQERVCDIHYRQMDKPDRDTNEAMRAQEECKELVMHYPNSKYAPVAQQRLRDIQEVLAENEFKVGDFYHQRGSFPAAANRLQALADHYPLFSENDQALWELADSYRRMGDRFENQEVAAYSRIVKDYPLSSWADEAKSRLQAMNRPVPAADPEALALEKYNLENRQKKGVLAKVVGPFESRPDIRTAAKTGNPNMQTFQPTVPVSVPPANGPTAAPGTNTVDSGVTAAVVSNTNTLDQGKDARAIPPGQNATSATAGGTAAPATGETTQTASAAPQPLPTNHPVKPRKQKKSKKTNQTPAATTNTPATTPAATPAAAPSATPSTAQPQQ
jgi:outer membrane protein assembly factor BamD